MKASDDDRAKIIECLQLICVCHIESAKPQKAAITKKIAGLEGSGLHKKRAMINAPFSNAPKMKIGTRPTILTIEPQVMEPMASAAP